MSMISHYIRKKSNGFFLNEIKDQESYSSNFFFKEGKRGPIAFPNLFFSFFKNIRPYEYAAIVFFLIISPMGLSATHPNFTYNFKSFDVKYDVKKPTRDFLSYFSLVNCFPTTMTTAFSLKKHFGKCCGFREE